MNDDQLIASGTEKVFQYRHSGLVIGLTGRTGSGCTTVADILAKSYPALELPDLPNPAVTNEQRKNRIVHHWVAEYWRPFTTVHVSHIIALFAIEQPPDDFFSFIKTNLSSNPIDEMREDVENASLEAARHRNTLEALSIAKPRDIRDAAAFYWQRLPALAEEIKTKISAFQPGAYTKLFQTIGDNLRKTGTPFGSTPDPGALFIIPQAIEGLIGLGQAINRLDENPKGYFVIDALRHPYEILYLRDRFPQFYAIAITTKDTIRKARLEGLNYRQKEIEALDAKEYPDDETGPKGYDKFVSQNIQACLDNADIFVSNVFDGDKETTKRLLAQEVCRYIALMQHPGLVTPTAVERCMQAAFAARLNSGCISRQVGAVITDDNCSIKSVGWNDVPRGQVPCLLRYSRDLLRKAGDSKAFSRHELENDEFRKVLRKNKLIATQDEHVNGRHITYCFKSVINLQEGQKNQVHTRALHAEENAFLQIVKYGGQGIEGGFLFTTSSPCELCAKKAAQLGIKKIFYIDPYPGISSEHIFGYDSNIPDLILFSGVIGHAYHRLYTPIMPYKDELKLVTEQKDLFDGAAGKKAAK